MYRFPILLMLAGLLANPVLRLHAQDAAAQALALAEKREMEERYNRVRGEIQDLTDTVGALRSQISKLTAELNRLGSDNATLSSKLSSYVSRDELRKLAEKMQEIETKRESDKKLIMDEIQRLAKVAATPPPVIQPRPSPKLPADAAQDFFPYTIKKGDTLSEIIKVYNADLKDRGLPPVTLDQVKKANPKINPDRLPAGREILLPVPSK